MPLLLLCTTQKRRGKSSSCLHALQRPLIASTKHKVFDQHSPAENEKHQQQPPTLQTSTSTIIFLHKFDFMLIFDLAQLHQCPTVETGQENTSHSNFVADYGMDIFAHTGAKEHGARQLLVHSMDIIRYSNVSLLHILGASVTPSSS